MLIVVTDLPIQYSWGNAHLYDVECSMRIKYHQENPRYQPQASDAFYAYFKTQF